MPKLHFSSTVVDHTMAFGFPVWRRLTRAQRIVVTVCTTCSAIGGVITLDLRQPISQVKAAILFAPDTESVRFKVFVRQKAESYQSTLPQGTTPEEVRRQVESWQRADSLPLEFWAYHLSLFNDSEIFAHGVNFRFTFEDTSGNRYSDHALGEFDIEPNKTVWTAAVPFETVGFVAERVTLCISQDGPFLIDEYETKYILENADIPAEVIDSVGTLDNLRAFGGVIMKHSSRLIFDRACNGK